MRKAAAALLALVAGLILIGKGRGASGDSRSKLEVSSAEPGENGGGTNATAEPAIRGPAAVAGQSRPVSNIVDEVRGSIRTLNACYESGCGLGESDPKGPYFEIGRRIKAQLNRLETSVQKDQFIDPVVSEIAREALANSDGHVKAGALDLIATQPVSSENLAAILNDVILDSDPELIEQGLLELDRYERSGDQDQINQTLKESLLHGAPFVALKIAEQIGAVLNPRNARFFADVAAELDVDSRVKAELLKALNKL